MIDFNEYEVNSSIKVARKTFLPKKLIYSFYKTYIGTNLNPATRKLRNEFDLNATSRGQIVSYAYDEFDISVNHTIRGERKEKPISAYHEMDFDHTFEIGGEISKHVLQRSYEIYEFNDYASLLRMNFERVRAISEINDVISCNISKNLFSYVIFRESIENGVQFTKDQILGWFYYMVLVEDLISKLINSIKYENREQAFQKTRKLIKTVFDPYFEFNDIEDFKTLTITELFYCFGTNLKAFVNLLNCYSGDISAVLKDSINAFLETLDDKQLDILSKRETMTLNEIGVLYELTRERVRQIEAVTIEKFQTFYNENLVFGNEQAVFIFPNVCSCVSLKDLVNGTNYNDAARGLLTGIEYGEGYYSKKLDSLVNNQFSEEFIDKTITEILGNYFKKSLIESKVNRCLEVLKPICGISKHSIIAFISSQYKLVEECYFKNGFSHRPGSLIEVIFSKYFDDGFHFSDENQLHQFHQYCIEEFGFVLNNEPDNFRWIEGILERVDCQLVDRGTYIHSSKVKPIPDNLVEQIKHFIYSKDRAISDNSLFEQFKEPLTDIGITNQYMLHGALNIYKDVLFKTTRNTAAPLESGTSLKDAIKKWLLSQKGLFDYEDFKKEFVGVKSYVMYNNIDELGCFQNIFGGKYIAYDKLHISKPESLMIEIGVKQMIDNSSSKYVSKTEIHNYFIHQHFNFVDEYKITDANMFFSIVEFVFRNNSEYKIRRPFIGKKDAEFKSFDEYIENYIDAKDVISCDVLQNDVNKKFGINTSYHVTYIDYFKKLRNDFVMVGYFVFVRKNLFKICDKDLIKLDVLLEMILKDKQEVDIEDDIVSKGYFSEISGYECNRFLLAGVINSYLNNYEIRFSCFRYDAARIIVKKKI